MASPYANPRGSSGGSAYARAGGSRGSSRRTSGKNGSKKERYSATGFLGNALHGVEAGTIGAVAALPATAKLAYNLLGAAEGSRVSPETSAAVHGIANQYRHNYSSPRNYLGYLYHDPVGAILDASTIASFGLTGLVKGGVVASRAGKAMELADAAGNPVTKTLARGEMRAQLQAAGLKAANREVKVGSKVVRPKGAAASKVVRQNLHREDMNRKAWNNDFNRALKRAGKNHERVAGFLRAQMDRPALDQYVSMLKKNGTPTALKTVAIIENPKVQDLFDHPTEKVLTTISEAKKIGAKHASLIGVDPATADARRFLPARIAGGAKWDAKAGDWVGGPSIEELKARGLDPVYMPHTTVKGAKSEYGGTGNTGIPNKVGASKQNKAVLMQMGQLIMDPAVMNDAFLKATKYAHYNDVHDALQSMATPVDHIPDGWTYIRQKRSERMRPTDRYKSNFNEFADTHLGKNGEMLGASDNQLLTKSSTEAMQTVDGRYLAVPNKIAKQLAGEFTRTNQFFYYMQKYPLKVWRALILGLKPAYLVNNVVGNTFMYIVHSAHPEDVKQLAKAFKQFVKPNEQSQVDRLLLKYQAGQLRGGFVATQMPKFQAESKIARAANWTINAIPSLDRRWEQALRRAKAVAEYKKHPALKKHATLMGKDTTFFENVTPLLEKDPSIHEAVYNRVNDALGDYEHMTGIERGLMRNLFPFYAWYRSILGVTRKLVIEQPLKVTLAYRLAQIAIEQNAQTSGIAPDNAPSSMLGFIPFGPSQPDGRVAGLNTAMMNPYATVGQLAESSYAALPGGPLAGPYLPGVNPIFNDIVTYLTGKNLAGYSGQEVPGMGTIAGLPQLRLWKAYQGTMPKGNTLNDHAFIDELLRYMGVPYARVSPSAAKKHKRV